MSHEPLVMMIGGGEILVILLILFLLGLGAAAIGVVVYFAVTSGQKKSRPPLPPNAGTSRPLQRVDFDDDLRKLAKLKEDGLITEEEFNLKKKALLGL